MAIARRPLLTATAAGTLLCALWFVPSANATDDAAGGAPSRPAGASTEDEAARRPALAETGTGADTTAYLIGGTAFLGIGAGFVTYSTRRTAAMSSIAGRA
ncbi:LPXTG cell wall anchor domain-containing protein [Streptomyces sp. NPDC056333]|uniref:LPXTG cell wall anchor domain-containing protein n=1 Tax=Streptomyces sp. NPDC056333 TaxID=3345786 RepID=UPI0035DAA298